MQVTLMKNYGENMKLTTIKKMNEIFAGKICTILTLSTNKNSTKCSYTEQQFTDFFTGIVESVDEDGIFVSHALTHCKSWFPLANIVGILEEQTIDDSDPRYEELTQNSQPENCPIIEKNDSPYIDPDMLSSLIAKS